MSYPRPFLPRMYFSGRFYTDPSTTNNWVNNYDVDNFRPNNQLLRDEQNFNGSWNPDGSATFALVDCQATGTFSPSNPGDGMKPLTDDIVVGETIEYNRRSVYGKISDLDPQMQQVSSLYGVRVNLGAPGDDDAFCSVLMPTSFCDMWGGIYNPNAGDGMGSYMRGYSATYQGLLKLDYFKNTNSTFLADCAPYVTTSAGYVDDNGETPYTNGALSIHFRVDWYCNDPDHEDFCYGNVTGYITPWLPDYPLTFDLGRQLYTTIDTDGTSSVTPNDDTPIALSNMAYATVEQEGIDSQSLKYRLLVDLGNSLYRTEPTGKLVKKDNDDVWEAPYQDQGTLDIGYFSEPWDPAQGGVATFTKLAEVPYMDKEFDDACGVMSIELADVDLDNIATAQLGLRSTMGTVVKYPLAEAMDGFFARADRFVFHLQGNDPTPVKAKIYCSQWGVPVEMQNIVVGFDSSAMQSDGQSANSGPIVGKPVEVLTIAGDTPTDEDPDNFSTTIQTGADGYAALTLQGGDCAHPRGYLDGQIYALRFAAGDTLPDINPTGQNNEKVNFFLFDVYDGPVTPDHPSWLVDILPIFQQYANLYPSMHRIVRLDDYGSVVMRRQALLRAFTSDPDNATYMPTTRDLSVAKRDMIVSWLNDDTLPFMNQTVGDVYAALQTIIELEHATMPPYLTALYSIKPGYNAYIADTLRDVAMQEMLHMALACNILTAIGGKPNINKTQFVPKFPGPLPGGLRSGLIMRLRKCSIEQIKSFVEIEAPEEQYLLEDGQSSETNTAHTKQKNQYTIGWVYTAVNAALTKLHNDGDIQFPIDLGYDEDSTEDCVAHQVVGAFGDKLFKIMSIDDAIKAIDQIMTEGEGSPADNNPADGDTDEETGLPVLSHYFRFQEIVKGRRLIIGEREAPAADDTEDPYTYSYNGPRVELNTDGVYNMQDDPKIEEQPIGSQQRERMESFARKYQGLLNGLQIAFTQDPSYLNECLALMFQLTIHAQQLMEMPALEENGEEKEDGTTCGVSFQVPLSD